MTSGGHAKTGGEVLSVDLDAMRSWQLKSNQELEVPTWRSGGEVPNGAVEVKGRGVRASAIFREASV